MSSKHSVETKLINFLNLWSVKDTEEIMELALPLIRMFSENDELNSVFMKTGDVDVRNMQLIRMAYLVCRFSEKMAGKLVRVRTEFKGFHLELEKIRDAVAAQEKDD